jgi:hypothetical protein
MHKLNSCVQWATGLAGTTGTADRAPTIKNPSMRDLIARAGSLVGHFAHSSCGNDAMRDLQDELVMDNFADYIAGPVNLTRRNDTR